MSVNLSKLSSCLRVGFREKPTLKFQGQIVDSEVDPRKKNNKEEWGSQREEKRKLLRRVLSSRVSLWALGTMAQNMSQSHLAQGPGELGQEAISSYQALLGDWPTWHAGGGNLCAKHTGSSEGTWLLAAGEGRAQRWSTLRGRQPWCRPPRRTFPSQASSSVDRT